MKKILFIFSVLFSTLLYGQYDNIRNPLRIVYSGDTCDAYFVGDTMMVISPTQTVYKISFDKTVMERLIASYIETDTVKVNYVTLNNETISDWGDLGVGDMLKSVYDTDNDGIVDTSEVSVDFLNSVAAGITAEDTTRWGAVDVTPYALYQESSGVWKVDGDTITKDTVYNTLSAQSINVNTIILNNDTIDAIDMSTSDTVLNYLSTGIISGFTITINADTTKIDIAAGVGNIVDNSNPANPTITRVNYSGATGVVITNIATANASYLGLNSLGVLYQQTTDFTPEQRDTILKIGVAVHSNRTYVNVVNNLPDVTLGATKQFSDFLYSFGSFNISGNVISANGANLSINKSAGVLFKRGSNFLNKNTNPNVLSLSSLTAPSNMTHRLSDGTEYTATAFIDPNNYESSPGVRSAVTNNYWTILRFGMFSSNLIRIQYGQNQYKTIAEAKLGLYYESFTAESNIAENGIFRCALIVQQGTTNLQAAVAAGTALFVESDFRGSFKSAGVGGGTTTLSAAYLNSEQPQITTSAALGEVQIMRGSASDNDTVFSILNGTGQTKLSVLGTGKLTNDSVITQNIIVDEITTINSQGIESILNGDTLSLKIKKYDGIDSPTLTLGTTGKIQGTYEGLNLESNYGLIFTNYDTVFHTFDKNKIRFNISNTFIPFGITWIPADIYSYSLYYDPDSLHFCWARLQEFRLDTLDRVNMDTANVTTILTTNGTVIYNNTFWDDLSFPSEELKTIGAVSKPDYDVTNLGLLFPQNDTTETVGISGQMHHRWKEETSIYPHIHWIQATTDTADFYLKYRIYNRGDAVPSTWTIISSNNHIYQYTSGAGIHNIASFPAISMIGKTISCQMDFIIYRKDNRYVGDALMKFFDIHYEVDSPGSATSTSKF